MTTDSSGGAEFAARGDARGAAPARPRDGDAHRHAARWRATPRFRCSPIAIGPKLSTRQLGRARAALAAAAALAGAGAARARRPTTCCLVHYKKEQLLVRDAARGAATHGRVGGVGSRALPAAPGAAAPRLPARGRAGGARDGDLRGHARARSPRSACPTRRSSWSPTCCAPRKSASARRAERACAQRARDPRRGVRRRLHLALSPQEAQRRGRARGAARSTIRAST